jgi:hypothetical protein
MYQSKFQATKIQNLLERSEKIPWTSDAPSLCPVGLWMTQRPSDASDGLDMRPLMADQWACFCRFTSAFRHLEGCLVGQPTLDLGCTGVTRSSYLRCVKVGTQVTIRKIDRVIKEAASSIVCVLGRPHQVWSHNRQVPHQRCNVGIDGYGYRGSNARSTAAGAGVAGICCWCHRWLCWQLRGARGVSACCWGSMFHHNVDTSTSGVGKWFLHHRWLCWRQGW